MFEIDVVSEPSYAFSDANGYVHNSDHPQLTRYDERLVTPAILIADKVRLFTMREDYLRFVASEAFKNSQMPMRFMKAFARLSMRRDPRDVAALGLTVTDLASSEDAEEFMNWTGEDFSVMKNFGDKYYEKIYAYQAGMAAIIRQRRDDLTSPSLQKATDSGLLTVEPWLLGELSPYQLAWTQVQQEYYPAAVDGLARRLGSMSGATLLEPSAQRMLASEHPGGFHQLSPSAAGDFDASAALTAALTANLPELGDMPLDEVLDLRTDLLPYLAPFRAHVMELGESIAASATDESPVALAKEVERVWHRDVDPALQELRHEVSTNRYGRHLLSSFSEDKASAGSTASAAVLAVGSVYAGLGTLIPAAAVAAYPFIKALNDTLKTRGEIRKNRLYLLHRVRETAASRK